MSNNKRLFLSFLTILITSYGATGQVTSSPISKFGIGDLFTPALARNQGMGGIGIGAPTTWHLNNQNPALLVNNFLTTFSAGLQLERRTITDGVLSQTNTSGNLNYLAIAFPIKSGKWTTSLGLMPYSQVNYKISYLEYLEGGVTPVAHQEKGSGGIDQVYWSNGFKIIGKHRYQLSGGVKFLYLFSSIVKQELSVINSQYPTSYYASLYERNYVKDFNLGLSLAFRKDSLFNRNNRFTFGVVYDFKKTLRTQHFLRKEQKTISGVTVDSLTLLPNVPGSITIPQSIGAGMSFGRPGWWLVGADFTYLDYTQFRGFDATGLNPTTTIPTKGFRSAFGLEVTPNPNDFSNYLNRVTFRGGLGYDQYPYLVNNNYVKDFGINFGLSLPVGRASTVDMAIKIGKRGNVTGNTIEENYLKVYFGVTFNDQWFIKRKFD